MTSDELITVLRSATEDEIAKALDQSVVEVPLSEPIDLLEFYNCMIDVMLRVRDDQETAESVRIPPGFGSTD